MTDANKFANRCWVPNFNGTQTIYELHFTEFYDDEILATITKEPEDDTGWTYTIPSFHREEEYLDADSLEEACSQMEELIIEHWQDEITRLKECIEKFSETN